MGCGQRCQQPSFVGKAHDCNADYYSDHTLTGQKKHGDTGKKKHKAEDVAK